MDAKETLYSKLNEIQDLEIRNFVKVVLDNAPKEFWTDQCSSTGKYHPPENQGNGGIIRHLIKCVITARDLCFFLDISQQERDIVIAALILHDIKKHGEPWGPYAHKEHGKIASEFLDNFQLREPEKTEIKNCVRYHLGRFTGTKGDVERAKNLTKKELVVYLTDIFCSRKYASWLPGVNVKEEEIREFFNKFQGDEK